MTNFELLLNLLDKPFFRKRILPRITETETKDGENLLLKSLDLLEKGHVELSPSDMIKAKIISKIVHKMFSAYNRASIEGIQRSLGDPYFGEAIKRGLLTTLRGMEKYGIKKPFTPSAPFLVVWNLTNKCNLKCKHCYEWKKEHDGELNLEEKKDVVDQLDEMKVAALAFSGGEPTICPDFFSISEYVNKTSIYHSLATNGTFLSKDTVQRIKNLGYAYVQVSVDGDKKTHNHFRGSNCYDRTMEGIDNLLDADVTASIATTLTKYNKDQIFDMIDLAKKKGVCGFNLYKLVVTGRATKELDVSPQFKDQLYGKLVKWFLQEVKQAEKEKREPLGIVCTDPQYARKLWEIQIKEGREKFDMVSAHVYGLLPKLDKNTMKELLEFIEGCGAGHKKLDIDYNGNIIPCVFMPDVVLGNTRTDKISHIWENSPMLKALRTPRENIEGCGKCDYNKICGGCRAVSHANHKHLGLPQSLLQADTNCVLNQAS